MRADLTSQPDDGLGGAADAEASWTQATHLPGPYAQAPWIQSAYVPGPHAEAPDTQRPHAEAPDTQLPYAGAPDALTGSRGSKPAAQHVSPIRVIRRPWSAVAAAAGLLVIILGAAGLYWASHTGRSATPVGRPPVTPIPPGHWAAVPPAKAQIVPRPTGLVIPAIGVRTKLIRLGLTASGALQVPANVAVAGWYTGSPRPGGTGSAVIAGHIDSVSGPGVFYRLSELTAGDRVYVKRADGTLVEFRVTSVQTYPKDRFPTEDVYGPVPDPELRLITCGGAFDAATDHYLSNIVVYATEVS